MAQAKAKSAEAEEQMAMGSGGRKLAYIYGDLLCASTISGTSEPAVSKQTNKQKKTRSQGVYILTGTDNQQISQQIKKRELHI